MKTNTFKTLLVGTLLLTACSVQPAKTSVEKQIEANPVANKAEFNAEAKQALESADLTASEKEQITALGKETRAKIKALDQENLSLELLLFKNTLATDGSRKQLGAIRAKMQAISEARIKTTFDAVQKASKILGKKAAAHSNVVHTLMMREETQRITE